MSRMKTYLENVLKRTCHIQGMSCSLLRHVSWVETCLVFWRHVPKSTRHVSEMTCHSILCPKMTCLKCQMFVFWRHVRGKDKTCLVFRHVFLRHIVTYLQEWHVFVRHVSKNGTCPRHVLKKTRHVSKISTKCLPTGHLTPDLLIFFSISVFVLKNF